MPVSFEEILSKSSIIKDSTVLSPHYVPESLLYREEYIQDIMREVAPALKGKRVRNIFIYGKTGTGKTSSLKFIVSKFEEAREKLGSKSRIFYMNCRVYNSRYRVLQRFLRFYYDEIEKSGFGLSYFYEKLVEKLSEGEQIVLVLDEIDAVKDIDDLIYTLVRANDDIQGKGGLSLIGISNKLGFKKDLDPRSRSSLYEREIIFPPYDARQLRDILLQRVELGFHPNTVSEGAVNLISAITAQENGDARYALKLLQTAGEIADTNGESLVEPKHVEAARRQVEFDIALEAIKSLPINIQLVLYALAKMTVSKAKRSLGTDDDTYFYSGDLYQYYTKLAKTIHKKPKSARTYRDYITELDNLGLISTVFTSKGVRGHTRLIKMGLNPEDAIRIIERNLGL